MARQAQELHQRGHRVVVVAGRAPAESLTARLRKLVRTREQVRCAEPDFQHFSGSNVDVRVLDPGEVLLRSPKVPRADVVVATWWETAEWVASLPSDYGVKVYYVQGHETYPHLPEMRVRATYQLRMHKIAVSKWLCEVMATEYRDRDVSLAPNAVDTRHFDAPPRNRSANPTVGFIYSWDAIKGVDAVIDAIQRTRKSIPALRVLAFGAVRPSRNLPLPEGTEFHYRPTQGSIPGLYARCDAWLFGSRHEGFGLPLLEAMACRTPVVGTRAGAASELLAEGRGRVVDVDDSDAMARCLIEILRLPKPEWARVSESCRAEAERYDWTRCTSAFEAGLNRALERARGGECANDSHDV